MKKIVDNFIIFEKLILLKGNSVQDPPDPLLAGGQAMFGSEFIQL